MEKKNVTIYDIAREAQVSPATVSRILTGTTSVREEKRKKVMEVIEKYDFHPNANARALAENRNKSIAMVVAHSDNSYYSSVFAACESEAYRRGYVLLLMDTSSRAENEVSVLKRVQELRPEAMILCGGRIDLEKQDPEFLSLLRQTMGFTRIVVGSRSPLPGIPGISVDHRASMEMAVRYLAGLGHREIGFVYTGKQFYGTVERLAEFRRVMKELNLPLRKEWLIGVKDYSVDGGQEGAEKLLKLEKIPTALLGMNDMVSAGLLQGLLAAGLRVPEDISLMGFDDTFVTCITAPQLTSVGYDYQSYGAELVRAALEPEAELFLNGRSLGKKQPDGVRAIWIAEYEEGVLEARTEGALDRLATPGKAAEIRLTIREPEQTEPEGAESRVIQVEAELLDAQGNPAADEVLTCQVIGDLELMGLENGTPDDLTPYSENYRKTREGTLTAYFRVGTKRVVPIVHFRGENGLEGKLNL